MRVASVLGLFCLLSWAQDSPVVRGVVLQRDAGELSVRTADNQVFRYRFDARTYVERDHRSIDAAELTPGEPVEVVSEAVTGSPVRSARSIHVLPPSPRHHLPTPPLRARTAEIQKGDLTFSGLILSVTATRLTLHQREGGNQEILLRPETRYEDNGEVVAEANLKRNMRVFVRGSKNDNGQIEAYQVVWGSMLAPK